MSRFLHKGEEFGSGNREGADEPPGERKYAEVSGFGGEAEG
jgi:hypothetical protein